MSENGFRELPRGLRGLRLLVCGVILLVLAMFATAYPAGLSAGRFWGTIAALTLLLLMNAFLMSPIRGITQTLQSVQEWAFLILSAALVLAVVWLSGEPSVVYLLSITCGLAAFKRGAWPVGVIFGAACFSAWIALQIAMGSPPYLLMGTAAGLAAGIVFAILLMMLLDRYARQTRRAENLLKELTDANDRLEEAHRREKELAVSDERLRLARDLHDSVTQELYASMLHAQASIDSLDSGDAASAADNARECRDTARQALREMRMLVFQLHPPALREGGLAGALRARLDAVEVRGGMRTSLTVEGNEQLTEEVQAELYSIAQEALNNVIKHARAAEVRVRLSFGEAEASLEVSDDGIGLPPGRSSTGSGLGIRGMEERARRAGGELRVESGPLKGTRVLARVPARKE